MISQGVLIISPGLYWLFNKEPANDATLRRLKDKAQIGRDDAQRDLAHEQKRVLREQYPLERRPLSVTEGAINRTKEGIIPQKVFKPTTDEKKRVKKQKLTLLIVNQKIMGLKKN